MKANNILTIAEPDIDRFDLHVNKLLNDGFIMLKDTFRIVPTDFALGLTYFVIMYKISSYYDNNLRAR